MERVIIEASQCKGCGLCVESCTLNCLVIGSEINAIGYQYAHFEDNNCNSCGICFYVCPEPGAVTVIRERSKRETAAAGIGIGKEGN